MKKFIGILLITKICAMPTGMQVMHGNANADGFTVSVSDQSILHWDDFSIGKGELFTFAMPGKDSSVLNRVVGSETSQILGSLQANGQVFLINPNGVIFGADATVDTASLIVSSLDLANENFLSGGELKFQGTSAGAIVNLGSLYAQDEIVLIGHSVDNQGALNGANVFCAAGTEVLLQLGQGIYIQSRGLDRPTDENIFERGIHFSGEAEANAIEMRDGRVYLVAEEKIEVTGSMKAGEIHVLSSEIYIQGNADIDVSAEGGGGTVLVGGEYQGEGTPGRNAEFVFVGTDAKVNASAKNEGDGGRIIFWSDGLMVYFGNAFADAGELSGDGGFIEVSGFRNLQFDGKASTNSPHGKRGQVLLDPTSINLTISAAATSANYMQPAATMIMCSTNAAIWSATGLNPCLGGSVANVNNAALVGLLNTSDVIVTTANFAGCNNTGTIEVQNNIQWTSGAGLKLDAIGGIIIDGGVTISSTGTPTSGCDFLNLLASSGGISIGTGVTPVTIQGNGNLTIHSISGDIDFRNATVTLTPSAAFPTPNISVANDGGSIVFENHSGALAAVTTSGFNGADASITLSATPSGMAGGLVALTGDPATPNSSVLVGALATTTNPNVGCNITINATQIQLTGGAASNSWVQLGNTTSAAVASILRGDINLGTAMLSIPGAITVTAGGQNSFALIGHSPSGAQQTDISGAVFIQQLGPSLTLNGGTVSNGAFAQIGHGGNVNVSAPGGVNYHFGSAAHPNMGVGGISNNTPLSTIGLASITLNGGTQDDTFAAIGFTGSGNINFVNDNVVAATPAVALDLETFISPLSVTLNAGTGANNAGAYYGAFFYSGNLNSVITSPASPNNIMMVTMQGSDLSGGSGAFNLTLNGGTNGQNAGFGFDTFMGSTINNFASTFLIITGSSFTNPITHVNIPTILTLNAPSTGSAFIQDTLISTTPANEPPHNIPSSIFTFGSASITNGSNGHAFIVAGRDGQIQTLNDIDLVGTTIGNFPVIQINNRGLISSIAGNVVLVTGAIFSGGTGGPLSVIAGQDISAVKESFIFAQAPTSELILITDNAASPAIGPGGFQGTSLSSIGIVLANETAVPLRIYTAKFSQNVEGARLNFQSFTGSDGVNDTHNLYGITNTFALPNPPSISSVFAPPTPGAYIHQYRVYYKELSNKQILSTIQPIPFLFPANQDFFVTELGEFGYNCEGGYGKEFTVSYDQKWSKVHFKPGTLATFQVYDEEYYLLMLRKYLLNQDPL